MDRKELYAKVAQSLIDMMAEGIAPWSKPWACSGIGDPNAPHNGITGRYYRGYNRLYLGYVAHAKGYSDPRWMTYKQAKEAGAQVRKGEKGTTIVFNSPVEKKDKGTGEVTDRFWLTKAYTVFNVAQIDGLTLGPLLLAGADFEPHDEAQAIADGWLETERVPLTHGGDRACYSPAFDAITMPDPRDFTSPEHYYQTLFHEIVHSSGHEKRLKRIESTTFGSDEYAKEELVAEIGAAMLYATAGLDRDLMEHSAAYLKSWASRLQDDPGLLVTAANAAERAAEYIMERVPVKA
jgi:hypothetical protein